MRIQLCIHMQGNNWNWENSIFKVMLAIFWRQRPVISFCSAQLKCIVIGNSTMTCSTWADYYYVSITPLKVSDSRGGYHWNPNTIYHTMPYQCMLWEAPLLLQELPVTWICPSPFPSHLPLLVKEIINLLQIQYHYASGWWFLLPAMVHVTTHAGSQPAFC